jgi:hypothetical protein
MKNRTLKFALITAFIGSVFISCQEDETVADTLSFPSDEFVSFEESGKTVSEASGMLTIKAQFSTNATKSINASFTSTSETAVEGVDYEIVDNRTTFDFAEGVYTNTIDVIVNDNLDVDGSKTIVFTITDGGFPGDAAINSTYTLIIEDDDCPFTLQELGDASWAGFDNSGGEGNNASQITSSFDGTNLLVEGIAYGWLTNPDYWEEVVIVSNPVIVVMDSLGNLTIALQPLATCTWLGDVQADYSIAATGAYSACTETMVINWDLYQNGAILRSYTETITKN